MTTIPTHMTEQLRNELEQLLAETDQFVANADNANTSEEAKTWIRRAHETQRETRLNNAKDFITQKEDDLIANLANGTDVNPEHIDPTITPVITQHDKDLWKYASLTWSVPVSEGYGRRTKFLVRDRQNGKLIAIFALGDPVIALGPRDDTIGWNKEQRHNRLYNVFDAFVLGAIDPYRQLLAGKLVALCALANETRTFLTNKSSGTTTVLREEQKNPTPVLITTSSHSANHPSTTDSPTTNAKPSNPSATPEASATSTSPKTSSDNSHSSSEQKAATLKAPTAEEQTVEEPTTDSGSFRLRSENSGFLSRGCATVLNDKSSSHQSHTTGKNSSAEKPTPSTQSTCPPEKSPSTTNCDGQSHDHNDAQNSKTGNETTSASHDSSTHPSSTASPKHSQKLNTSPLPHHQLLATSQAPQPH